MGASRHAGRGDSAFRTLHQPRCRHGAGEVLARRVRSRRRSKLIDEVPRQTGREKTVSKLRQIPQVDDDRFRAHRTAARLYIPGSGQYRVHPHARRTKDVAVVVVSHEHGLVSRHVEASNAAHMPRNSRPRDSAGLTAAQQHRLYHGDGAAVFNYGSGAVMPQRDARAVWRARSSAPAAVDAGDREERQVRRLRITVYPCSTRLRPLSARPGFYPATGRLLYRPVPRFCPVARAPETGGRRSSFLRAATIVSPLGRRPVCVCGLVCGPPCAPRVRSLALGRANENGRAPCGSRPQHRQR
jgi:hypothetical protein